MPFTLLRVDERLIHGQVVLGWGSQLRPDRYVVVDDALAVSDWEQELYRLGAGDAEVVFAGRDTAREALAEWHAAPEASVLLTRDIETMAYLTPALPEGVGVNLGGLHHGAGRREVLTYLHISDQDLAALQAMEEAGVMVHAQDLPDAPRVPLATMLRG